MSEVGWVLEKYGIVGVGWDGVGVEWDGCLRNVVPFGMGWVDWDGGMAGVVVI